jgi:hypothetical protein
LKIQHGNNHERLANIGKDVLEQHRMNLACLTEINALSGIVEEAQDDISDIEDLQEDLGGVADSDVSTFD